MRCVFFGTPEFAVPSLRTLHASPHEVMLVITQPDRGKGRGQRLQPPPVKECARALEIPVLQPQRASAPDVVAELRRHHAEVIVVVAFGQLLKEPLLILYPYGCVNLHPSLLPKYRGASPIAAPLLNGDEETGVTTMALDAGLDSGDILLQETLPIAPDDTAGSLHDRLAQSGARLMVETLGALEAGTVRRRSQDTSAVTLTQKLRKEDGCLDWGRPAAELERLVRAYTPWPGAYTFHRGARLRVLAARLGADSAQGQAGSVASIDSEGMSLHTSRGILVLTQVQQANKAPMSAAAYLRGHRLEVGEMLGEPPMRDPEST